MATTVKYLTTTSENYGVYLKAAGFPAEVADLMDKARPTLEWTRTDTGCTVTTINGDKRHTVTFIFDKEVESELAGKKFKMTASRTDNSLVIKSTIDGKAGRVVFKKTEGGLEEDMEVDGVKARRIYKKL